MGVHVQRLLITRRDDVGDAAGHGIRVKSSDFVLIVKRP